MGEEDLAEEAVQEAMASCLHYHQSYDTTKPMKLWVYRIVTNTARRAARGEAIFVNVDDQFMNNAIISDKDYELAEIEERELFYDLFHRYRPTQKEFEVLTNRYIYDIEASKIPIVVDDVTHVSVRKIIERFNRWVREAYYL